MAPCDAQPRAVVAPAGHPGTGQKTRSGRRGPKGDRSRSEAPASTCMGGRSPPKGVPGAAGPGWVASPTRTPRNPHRRRSRNLQAGRRCTQYTRRWLHRIRPTTGKSQQPRLACQCCCRAWVRSRCSARPTGRRSWAHTGGPRSHRPPVKGERRRPTCHSPDNPFPPREEREDQSPPKKRSTTTTSRNHAKEARDAVPTPQHQGRGRQTRAAPAVTRTWGPASPR